jgi:hypothetical protein
MDKLDLNIDDPGIRAIVRGFIDWPHYRLRELEEMIKFILVNNDWIKKEE